METLKRSVLARGERGGRDEYRKGFSGSEAAPYDPTMADTRRYTFADSWDFILMPKMPKWS